MSNSSVAVTSATSQPLFSSVQSTAQQISNTVATSAASTVTTAISTRPDVTTTVPPSSSIFFTSIVSASSVPRSTAIITSVITQAAESGGRSSARATTVIITTERGPASTTAGSNSATSTVDAAASSSSAAAALSNQGSSNAPNKGLSSAGKTAIAVVVPVVVVALLVLGALFLWRKKKQKKTANAALREQVEDYNYNPNQDPTLPVVAAGDGHTEMTEDRSGGYRGWGATNTVNRNPSTTLSNGHTQGKLSDSGSTPNYSTSPIGAAGDDNSGDYLVHDRDTYGSDDLGALGAAPVAGARRNDMQRGKSNASSSYSAGNRSEHSDHYGQPMPGHDAYSPSSHASQYGQHTPYPDNNQGTAAGMPIVRDVSARRNMRIEQGGAHQAGNSGIAQNF